MVEVTTDPSELVIVVTTPPAAAPPAPPVAPGMLVRVEVTDEPARI